MKDKLGSKILQPVTFSPLQAVACPYCLNQGIQADKAIAFMRLDSSAPNGRIDVMCENGHGFVVQRKALRKVTELTKGKNSEST